MVLFVDGFDYGDALHQGGQVSPFFPCCKYTDYSSVTSVSIQPGRFSDSLAFEFANSGFRQQTKTKIFGAVSSTYCFGAAFNISNYTNPGKALFRFEAGGVTLVDPGHFDDGTNTTTALMVEVTLDGTIQVCTGYGGTPNFPGTVLASTSSGAFPLNTWVYLEATVNSSTGGWALYMNDALLLSGTSGLIPTGIDRYSIMGFGFETHQIDDSYLTDGARLGPCRVFGFAPNFGSTHQWAPLTGTNLSQVEEFGNRVGFNTPDDDTSYIEATGAGITDLYGFPAPSCYGLILALALNADGKAVSPGPSLDYLYQFGGTQYGLGFSGSFSSGYGIQQVVSQQNPATSTNWTDADIGAGLFGFSFAGSGDARVTQFMMEKLVSLRSVPFNCGQGSYSFTN